MHISIYQLIAGVALIAGIVAIIWLLTIAFRRERYTREKFAFVALTGFFSMAASAVSALAHKETPWGSAVNLVKETMGMTTQADPPRVADHVLMVVVLFLVAAVVIRFYEKWDGAVSVRHYTKDRYHEAAPLIIEGLAEAKRIIKRDPPLEIYASEQNRSFASVQDQPEETLVWHLQARDLILLRSPSYVFDRTNDWHDEGRCWIGRNKKTSQTVAVRCDTADLSHNQVVRFVEYVQRVANQGSRSVDSLDLIIAIRNSSSTAPEEALGYKIKKETERTLLDGLVDFSDYFSEIRQRVESQLLPDSSLTIKQVYTPSSCREEAGTLHEDLEAYLSSWLAEGGQRQIALLGEYGQGKSTSALIMAYHIIESGASGQRVPILIELRGKSPRHMIPEDILAAWAYPYGINPRAVMKLIAAGRVFLILEGFDEMALIGDSESRLSHFRTLWKFCYPKAKILITGRPNFFLDDQELRAGLGISKSSAAGPYCEAIHLEPFTVGQIKDALRAVPSSTRDEIMQLAKKDAKFHEIVSRGSLLYVVSQLWERAGLSKYAGRITSAFVMDLFIQHSYRRQSLKTLNSSEFMILNEAERKYFMSGIAAHMGALELPNQITREQFEKAVKELYEVIPESASIDERGIPQTAIKPLRKRLSDVDDAVQGVANDVRSSGILVLDQSNSGALRFAHKSFMEYLVAKVYGDHVTGRNREVSSAIMVTSRLEAKNLLHHPETLAFLAEIFLGVLTDGKQPLLPPVSKRLFELIVVRPSGIYLLEKWRARLALRSLVSVSVLRIARKEPGVGLAVRLLKFYAHMFLRPEFLFVGIAIATLESFAFSSTFRHRAPNWAWSLAVLVLMILVSFQVLLMDWSSNSAARLWFICCVVNGLTKEDIAATVGAKWVLPIANYLEVVDKLEGTEPGTGVALTG